MRFDRPLNRVSRIRRHRRKAMVLLQMLSVLFIVAVGSTLMTTSIASIMRTKKHADALTSRYAVLTDFTRCLRRDVRGSTTMTLRSRQDDDARVLTLERERGLVSYTFLSGSVERVGFDADAVSDKTWSFARTLFSVNQESRDGDAVALLHVTVQWQSLARDDLQPQRRFDLVFRNVGEIYDEQR